MTAILRRPLLAAAILAAPAVQAQGFPQRSLRALVPVAPGSAADVFARLLAPALGYYLGQGVVVENMGGGATRVGTSAVVRSPPDGHTLLITNDSLAAIEALPLPRRPSFADALAPVLLGASAPLVLVTHPRSGIVDAASFAARLRARERVTVGVPGAGSTPHFASALLAEALGGRVEPVMYRGAGPLVADLVAGSLDTGMLILAAAIEQIRDGRLIALGVTSPQRNPTAPEIPSFAEGLAPGFAAETWIGILAPAATPAPALAKLVQASGQAMAEPSVTQRLHELGFETPALGPDRFGPLLRETVRRYAAIAATIGLKAEDL